jgi:hypothetical protein
MDILTKLTLPSIALTILKKLFRKATLKALNQKTFHSEDDCKKIVNIITPIKHSSQEKIYSIILYGRARGCFQTLFYQKRSLI